jgi:hypothetical protein
MNVSKQHKVIPRTTPSCLERKCKVALKGFCKATSNDTPKQFFIASKKDPQQGSPIKEITLSSPKDKPYLPQAMFLQPYNLIR